MTCSDYADSTWLHCRVARDSVTLVARDYTEAGTPGGVGPLFKAPLSQVEKKTAAYGSGPKLTYDQGTPGPDILHFLCNFDAVFDHVWQIYVTMLVPRDYRAAWP